MQNKELISKIVQRLNTESGIIILHHNADIDALGSAIALQSAYPNLNIGAFQKISHKSKKILKYFKNVSILEPPEISSYETIIILDASTPSQLGISQDQIKNPIIIDHHLRNEIWDSDLYYCDDSKTSCAELILEFLEFINFKITPQIGLALLIAILSDTGHFKYANNDTFINFAHILKISNLTMADVLKLMEDNDDIEISQRIAHLKGAQRLRYSKINEYIVVISQLSSFEASMCKKLLALGADIVFVGAQHNEHVRISARTSNDLVKNGLHLGEFFQSLGHELSCEGGGHAGAAGLNGIGDVEFILNTCVNKIAKIIKKKIKNI